MKKTIASTLLLFNIILLGNAQNFEGTITYKMEVFNPNPDVITTEQWETQKKATFGELGYIKQVYYYKGENYLCEMTIGDQEGYQLYNPKDKLLYSWQKGSNEAVSVDTTNFPDEISEVKYLEEKETLLGIVCNVMLISSKAGTMKIWYNKNKFKVDPSLYKGHVYGHWDRILQEIGCLPLKIEQKGYMYNGLQTAIDFKEQSIKDSKFILPTFTTVTAN